jgi:hypothetical protein
MTPGDSTTTQEGRVARIVELCAQAQTIWKGRLARNAEPEALTSLAFTLAAEANRLAEEL